MQALFEREQHPSSDIHTSISLNQKELGDVDGNTDAEDEFEAHLPTGPAGSRRWVRTRS